MLRSFTAALSAIRLTAFTACCTLWMLPVMAQDISVLPSVRLYEGTAPGSENPRFPESVRMDPEGRKILNVSVPDYTPYLPTAATNTRTAVIIAPGGGFRVLVADYEGHDLARTLAKMGIAAFVLKYRVIQTDPSVPMGPPPAQANGAPPPRLPSLSQDGVMGVADGERAIAMIRARAGEYAIDTNRIVFIGFSAGAHVAAYMGLSKNPAARANYVAPIYGAPFVDSQPAIPADMPPVFLVMSQDDRIAGRYVRAFYDALLAAGKQPEAHFYMDGGHGYGTRTLGKVSDAWPGTFFNWLRANGLTHTAGSR